MYNGIKEWIGAQPSTVHAGQRSADFLPTTYRKCFHHLWPRGWSQIVQRNWCLQPVYHAKDKSPKPGKRGDFPYVPLKEFWRCFFENTAKRLNLSSCADRSLLDWQQPLEMPTGSNVYKHLQSWDSILRHHIRQRRPSFSTQSHRYRYPWRSFFSLEGRVSLIVVGSACEEINTFLSSWGLHGGFLQRHVQPSGRAYVFDLQVILCFQLDPKRGLRCPTLFGTLQCWYRRSPTSQILRQCPTFGVTSKVNSCLSSTNKTSL